MMSNPYFGEFWIVSDKGKTLFPKLIKNIDSGVYRYQLLAKGSNRKVDGDETIDALVAIRRFLAGDSLRFGTEGETANRFDVDGGHVQSIGMSPGLWLRLR